MINPDDLEELKTILTAALESENWDCIVDSIEIINDLIAECAERTTTYYDAPEDEI